jgi:hypothetical protein
MPAHRRLRLCMKDLYQQDIVEMIERETRAFEVVEILDPSDPDFPIAYRMLWDTFGPDGEIEQQDDIERFMRDDCYEPTPDGTYVRFFLIVGRDREGRILGVRDGSVLINPSYDRHLCVIYLAHLYMRPEARGTVLSYEMRIAPVEIAMDYLLGLHKRGCIQLPQPANPARYYGMHLTLTAEMEYYSPAQPVTVQRILFYGRGGFDVINPRHFPYMQPDFRDKNNARVTGNAPIPLMVLVRRMGRERQATMPIAEASALMRLLYDDFACHWKPEELESSLQRVLDRLAARSNRESFVELLPLPTGPGDLARLRPLFREAVFRRYYKGFSPVVDEILKTPETAEVLARGYLDDELAKLAEQLRHRPRYVYPARDARFGWEGEPEPDGHGGL